MLKQENTMDLYSLPSLDDGNFGNYGDDLLTLELPINSQELAAMNSEELGAINSQGHLVVLSPPDISEDTLDVAATNEPGNDENVLVGHTVPPRGPPARTVFSGHFNFSVDISALDTHRKKYLYSHKLNRIYVDIKTDFPVQFRWDFDRAPAPMFVRATTVFSDESQAEKRVERCIQHTHESANTDVNMSIVKNVLHSSREPYTQGIYYSGDTSLSDSWYSVLVQFDGHGTDAHSHAYQFVCKNSCSSGINRRPIAIIFTLEDHFGRVYGRQMVGARVCACPRRDKLKDEEAAAERPAAHKRRAPPPAAKRVKLEHDAAVYELPPVSIVGLKTVITGLEVMLSTMEQVAEAKKHDPAAAELYHNPIAALRSEIDKLKNHPNGETN